MRERSRTTLRVATLAALAIVSVLAGCGDNGHKPVEAEYVLYAGVHSDGGGSSHAYIAVIDCQTDSVIDSFPVPASEVMALCASQDGKYLASNAHWIWNTISYSRVASLPAFWTGLFLRGGAGFLGSHPDSAAVYSVPAFERQYAVPTELYDAQSIPDHPLVIGIDDRGNQETPGPNLLRVLNYETREIVDSIVIAPDAGEEAMAIGKFVLSPDGSRLYALGATARGDQLIGYDRERREVLFRRDVFSWWGYCGVTPDGQEVWLTDAGLLDVPGWPPYIFILDALTGASLDSIDMRGFYPDSIPGYQYRSLEPQDIRFHPNGEKAYVYCGKLLNGHRQPLLVIDTQTRRVIKTLLDLRMWHDSRYDFEYLVESIDIGPKP